MNMKKMFEYKGFHGSCETSIEDECIFGKIECINDLVTYQADTINGLKEAFKEAVEDYIETCEEIGKAPEKPMSGSFNIRIGQELHKQAYLKAKNLDISLNEFVKKALLNELAPDTSKQIHFHFSGESTSKEFNYSRSEVCLPYIKSQTFKKPNVTH